MIPQNAFLALFLSLALSLFSSLATSAAIPLPSIRVYEYESETHQSTLKAATISPPTTNTIVKGRPLYFPETVPDASEIAERLTTLHQAGLVPSSQHPQPQNSIGSSSPNAKIDTRARVLHMCGLSVETWNATVPPLPLPPLGLFVFASSIVCVATIISKMRAPY